MMTSIFTNYILPYLPALIEAVISAIVISVMKAVQTHATKIDAYKESTMRELEKTTKEIYSYMNAVKESQENAEVVLNALAPELVESTKTLAAANKKAAKLEKKIVELEALVMRKEGDSDDKDV